MKLDLYELERKVSSPELIAALKKIDFDYCDYAVNIMEKTFHNVYKAEYSGQKSNYADFCSIFQTTATMLMRHFDESGLGAALGKVIHHLNDFSFTEHTAILAFDDNFLKKNLNVKPEKVQEFWKYCEEDKQKLFASIAAEDFSFEKCAVYAMETLTEKDGPAWHYGSNSKWVKMSGATLAAVNAAGALGIYTGVGGVLLACSVLAGIAGMAA